jgi:hypothetical protein
MSAFLCSVAHLSVLTIGITANRDEPLFDDEVFTMLLEENANSLKYRYTNPEDCTDEAIAGLRFNPLIVLEHPQVFTPAALIKLAQSYRYQACEHPEWQTTRACRLIDELISRQIRNLPGYEAAPWSI